MNKTIINRAALCVTCLTIIAGCGKEKKVVEQPVIPPPPPSAQDNLNSALLALNPNYNGRAKTGKNRFLKRTKRVYQNNLSFFSLSLNTSNFIR